jgi:uncharacterized protein (DUF1778 family)
MAANAIEPLLMRAAEHSRLSLEDFARTAIYIAEGMIEEAQKVKASPSPDASPDASPGVARR